MSALFKLLPFLLPSPASLKGYVNVDELKRVALTAATAGLGAFAIGVLSAIQSDAANIFTMPGTGTYVVAALGFAIDYVRRMFYHGTDASNA